ncbi:MAG: hypothetical protein K2W95_18345 [Candidatus Obscuribacterales bacterium]|nr:hypothetical protein [Candidatus Obscuribacterales bacterium]
MTREHDFLNYSHLKAFERRLIVGSLLGVATLALVAGGFVPTSSRGLLAQQNSKLDSRSYAEYIESADVALTRGNWRIAIATFEEAVSAAKTAKVSDDVVADLCLRAANCLSEYGRTIDDDESASLSADRRELARSAQHFFSCALALYESAGDKRGQLLVYELRPQSIVAPLLTPEDQQHDRLKKAELSLNEKSSSLGELALTRTDSRK